MGSILGNIIEFRIISHKKNSELFIPEHIRLAITFSEPLNRRNRPGVKDIRFDIHPRDKIHEIINNIRSAYDFNTDSDEEINPVIDIIKFIYSKISRNQVIFNFLGIESIEELKRDWALARFNSVLKENDLRDHLSFHEAIKILEKHYLIDSVLEK